MPALPPAARASECCSSVSRLRSVARIGAAGVGVGWNTAAVINEMTPDLPDAPAGSLPHRAQAELAGTAWEELPHVCTGRHGVPDTPDILGAVLAADPTRRVRAVGDLYRLLLNQEQVFPATTPAALVLACLLDDPRTLAEDRWERRAGRRPLRAELLNWLASFADIARLDVEDGVGTAQDLAAARAARPALHDRITDFCDDDDPLVREAALAATALLQADPALASSVPRYAPAVREVLAVSADSYYRWIARERLAAWGRMSPVSSLRRSAAQPWTGQASWRRTRSGRSRSRRSAGWKSNPRTPRLRNDWAAVVRTGPGPDRLPRTNLHPSRPWPPQEARRGTAARGGSLGRRSAPSGRSRRT